MDTQLATSQIRLQNWVAVIRDQKSSGLTIKDYCQEHDLSENAYYYWLRKAGVPHCRQQTSLLQRFRLRIQHLCIRIRGSHLSL